MLNAKVEKYKLVHLANLCKEKYNKELSENINVLINISVACISIMYREYKSLKERCGDF